MPRKAVEDKDEPKAKPEAKGFKVFDSNGKNVRVEKDEDRAKQLAKVYNGRYE